LLNIESDDPKRFRCGCVVAVPAVA